MLSADLRDLLFAFCAAEARFLVVGGYAVGIHGRPRATKDLDVWVEASAGNAPKVMRALNEFGAPLFGLTVEEFKKPGMVLQIGLPPNRIDILTKLSGVSFQRAWKRRMDVTFADGLVCPVIGFDDLLANKRASGRPQDLADVAALERLSRVRVGQRAPANGAAPRKAPKQPKIKRTPEESRGRKKIAR